MVAFLADASSVEEEDPFPRRLLEKLGELVGTAEASYAENDCVKEQTLAYTTTFEDEPEYPADLAWEVCRKHHRPCIAHKQGHSKALAISDFLTYREYRSSHLYCEHHRLWGIEDTLTMPLLPSPFWHRKTIMLDRKCLPTFGRRDHELLDALQPHFNGLHRAAVTRRTAAAALSRLERDGDADGAVILLGPGDMIDHASREARELLTVWFGTSGAEPLPDEVRNWLAVVRSGPNDDLDAKGPLTYSRGRRILTLEISGRTLLLRERDQSTSDGLTVREREVLECMSSGKTNSEIAELLWISPSTVRKHLENAYRKLGVTTRTAAAARLRLQPSRSRSQEAAARTSSPAHPAAGSTPRPPGLRP